MFSKLDEIERRFNTLNLKIQDPGIIEDQKKYRKIMKEISGLEKIVHTYQDYKNITNEIKSNKDLLKEEKESDFLQLIKEELILLEENKEKIAAQLKILLLPKDPNDEKNVIMEIRAGAGGDEASLFVEELFRSYSNYAYDQKWKIEVLNISHGNVGGFKEVCVSISGNQVYSKLKYESGVHRVQRVPKTESQGRVHTSTITVAILPEAEEVEVKVNSQELRIDVCRSSGAGGQHVNTTDSAVRITHIPSGIAIYCQEGKSQHQNKDKALKILYSRLLAIQEEKSRREASDARLQQIGTGDRSERIRTYNFPQSRISDHRIGLTTHALNEVMQGKLDIIITELITYFQAEALKREF